MVIKKKIMIKWMNHLEHTEFKLLYGEASLVSALFNFHFTQNAGSIMLWLHLTNNTIVLQKFIANTIVSQHTRDILCRIVIASGA